jgi:hypothetical protein
MCFTVQPPRASPRLHRLARHVLRNRRLQLREELLLRLADSASSPSALISMRWPLTTAEP